MTHWQLIGWDVPVHDLFVVLGAAVAAVVYAVVARSRGMADQAHAAVAAGALLGGALMAKGATAWRYLLTTDDASLYGVLAFGGKSVLGGLAGAYLGALATKRLVGIHHSTGDLFAPAVAAGMAVGRVGCLLTEPLGTPSALPWAVAGQHPSHAYEIGFHLVSLVLIVRYGHRVAKRGAVFTFWLLGYGVFRFGNEFLRENPDMWLGLSGSQLFLLVSVPLLALAVWRMWRDGLLRPPADREPAMAGAT